MGGILPGYPAPSSERRSLRRLPADGLNLEAQWVLAAQAGYTLAFDELVARNQDRIYRLAANITRNPSDAEDAVRATFISARAPAGVSNRLSFPGLALSHRCPPSVSQ